MPINLPILRMAWVLMLVALLPASAIPVQADDGESVDDQAYSLSVRIWQSTVDARNLYISTRTGNETWEAAEIISLRLDDRPTPLGRYRYGNIAFDVLEQRWGPPSVIEVGIWQDVRDHGRIYVSARQSGGSWKPFGTIPLPLDDGLHDTRPLRYGDFSSAVREPESVVLTLAGSVGIYGYQDGRGEEAQFGWRPETSIGLAVDRDGSVVVADFRNSVIRRVSLDGSVSTIAGGRMPGLVDGPADTARFESPSDVAIGPEGEIFVADCPSDRIRKISPDGRVTTVAGGEHPEGERSLDRDGPALEALLSCPVGLAVHPNGDVYFIQQTKVKRLSVSGLVVTVAGGRRPEYKDGPGLEARFAFLRDIDLDGSGNVYLLEANPYVPGEDGNYYFIRMIDTDGEVTTLYRGVPIWKGGVLSGPEALAVTEGGEVYITNTGRNQILRLVEGGKLEAIVGTGGGGHLNGPREFAELSEPGALGLGPSGALVFADQSDSVIRVALPDAQGDFIPLEHAVAPHIRRVEGVEVSALAGQGGFRDPYEEVEGYRDGTAKLALFHDPQGLAIESDGSILVVDARNQVIRRITAGGLVTTVAGNGYAGSGDGTGTSAGFSGPRGIAVDSQGLIYVAEYNTNLTRRIDRDGKVTTLDDWPGTIWRPLQLAIDPDDNLLVTERYEGRVWRLTLSGSKSLVVESDDSSVAGLAVGPTGTVYYAMSRGGIGAISQVSATGALSSLLDNRYDSNGLQLSGSVAGLAVASDGTLYGVDSHYGRVFSITPAGIPSIVVERSSLGDSTDFSPTAIAITSQGDLIVADSGLDVIWKITLPEHGSDP